MMSIFRSIKETDSGTSIQRWLRRAFFNGIFFFNAFFVFFFASLFKSNDNKQKKVDNNIYKVSFNVEIVLK